MPSVTSAFKLGCHEETTLEVHVGHAGLIHIWFPTNSVDHNSYTYAESRAKLRNDKTGGNRVFSH